MVSAAPISGLPEIGIMMRKSATADLRAARLEPWRQAPLLPCFETARYAGLLSMRFLFLFAIRYSLPFPASVSAMIQPR